MDYLSITLLILFSCTFFKIVSWVTKSSSTSLPPGPVPLPENRSLFPVTSKPHESLTRLAKVYGPLMSLKLGSVTTVVASSPAMAKEFLQKHDQSFTSRTILEAITVFNHHKFSMVWLPVSPEWRNLRKITNSHISATQKLDSLRRQKLDDLVSYLCLNATSGSVVNIGHASFTTVLNLISSSFFSIDVADYNSDSMFETALREGMLKAGKPNLSDYIPIISFMDVQGIKRRMRNYARIMDDTFDKIIDHKLELAKEGKSSSSNDLLDIILGPSHDNGLELKRHDIKALLKDLLMAATDTISATVEWVLAELLHNPSEMMKAQQELSNIISKDRPIEESDIIRLPYLQAIVKETLRLHPPAPFLLPYKAEVDVKIHDFVVPKDTQILINAWAIGRDPTIWADPTSFQPERFLDSKIDYKGYHFELIPFGSGRRICTGLPLAHKMTHLMIGLLLQSFDWKLENGMKPEDMNMEDGFGFT
ncbi:hypothetical protein MKW98_011170 [Papaver atlanticum]|uniref:Cytochrome P450 n=1 Tax=Papaver atlanticum TaxID=357466 RepID=A0AAD4XXR3_9MAGN|nr:hypothetical protein MKW98_011170 [Papaver atlanticum]